MKQNAFLRRATITVLGVCVALSTHLLRAAPDPRADAIRAAAAKAVADRDAAARAAAEKAAAAKAAADKLDAARKALAEAEAAVAAANKAKAEAEAKAAAAKEAEAKAAAEKAAVDKVAAIKAAAHKEALKQVAERKAALDKADADAAAKDAPALKTFTDRAVRGKVARDKEAADKAAEALAQAAKTLAEKEAALKQAQAEADAAKQAPGSDDKAKKAAAANAAVEKAERERAQAANTLRSRESTAKAAARQVEADAEMAAKLAAAERNKGSSTEKPSPDARKDAQAIQNFIRTAIAEQIDQERKAKEQAAASHARAKTALEQKTKAAEAARAKAASAREAADRAAHAEKAAEKTLKDAIATAEKDPSKAAARQAAEKALTQARDAAKKAAAAAGAAQDAEKKAAAELEAAASEVTRTDAESRTTLARFHEDHALVDGGLALLPADQWDYAKARHLLVRAGFGGTPEEIERLHAMGLHRAVEFLVDFHHQPPLDLAFQPVLPERPYHDESRLDGQRRQDLINMRRQAEARQQSRVRDWWIQRMVQSPRQLEEKLVLFWHGHFATEYRTVQDSYAIYSQNQLFREHAAGNFGALLHGIVHDPAMLRYLDNNSNVKGRPNENLAREIMELFAMGEGNYTEEDIMEGARALTGYTYDTATCQFRFIVARHDDGPKTIFGRTGNWAGDDFVDLILQQPFTSHFIARKLFVYFARENPDAETVARLAAVLRQNQFELAPMLKNLFMSREFYAPETMGTQIKSPVQLVIGTLRNLGVKDVSWAALASATAGMGQELFEPPNVRGWEGGRFWVNANYLFLRYNGVADVVERINVPGQPAGLDLVGVLEGRPFQDASEVVDYLARSCFGRSVPPEKQPLLLRQAAALPPSSQWTSQRNQVNAKLRALLVLMLSMPEYQCS